MLAGIFLADDRLRPECRVVEFGGEPEHGVATLDGAGFALLNI